MASINPLSTNPTKWSNTLNQFVSNLPTNCLSVFDHFVGFALKALRNLAFYQYFFRKLILASLEDFNRLILYMRQSIQESTKSKFLKAVFHKFVHLWILFPIFESFKMTPLWSNQTCDQLFSLKSNKHNSYKISEIQIFSEAAAGVL